MIQFQRAGQLGTLPPLSLYVHLPWCIRKCPYCDFNSHEIDTAPQTPVASPPQGGVPSLGRPGAGLAARKTPVATLLEARYIDALLADLESALPQVWGRRVHSIFIGGGTPSLFSPQAIDRLLADIRARLPLEPGCEITLEANPGTFEKDRFKGFRDGGVTRLSVGVQSFDDAKLHALGRVHDGDQARAAIDEARTAFDTFNIDLMYALPGQSLADLRADLSEALAFAPPHLSLYHLTIEPNTVFANQPPAGVPDEDTASDMMDLLFDTTAQAGLERYEVSAYAKPGHQCVHNLNYWQFGDYLGIGAGAHGKISFPDRIERQVRWREPSSYMSKALQGAACSNQHDIAAHSMAFEFMLNALRLRDGFEFSRFTERTGLSVASIQRQLETAQQRGLLDRDMHRAWPTPKGLDFLSDLQALFLAD